MDKVGERIKELMDSRGLNPLQFAKSIGYDRADKIYNVIKGNTGVSKSVISDILSVYKEISSDWLLTGSGPMVIEGAISPETSLKDIEQLKKDNDLLRAQNATLLQSNEALLESIRNFKHDFKELKDMVTENKGLIINNKPLTSEAKKQGG